MTARERIEAAGLDDVVIFEDPSYDEAFLGVTNDNVAVYGYEKMVMCLMEEHGMTLDEAADFISWNDSFHQEG